MPNFDYKFFFNSHGMVVLDGQVCGRRQDTNHYPSLDGYQPGDDLTLAYVGGITVEAYGEENVVSSVKFSERFVCEKLYQMFNAPWERPNEYAGPSMSIGDVVILFPGTPKEVAYTCAKEGFIRADIRECAQKPAPTQWVRDGEKMVQYLLAKCDDGIFLSDEEETLAYGGRG